MKGTASTGPLRGALVNLTVAAGMSAVLALAVAVILPSLRGSAARPPVGILADGVVEGCLSALTAAALILVYRISRVINFAQVAIGSSAGYFITQMVLGYDLPVVAMIPPALAIAFGAGVLAELAMRRFAHAPRLLATVVTITLAPAATLVMGQIVSGLNPLPPSLRLQSSLRSVPTPFPGFHLRIQPLSFTFGHVFTVGATMLVLPAVALLLKTTRFGRAARAVAENPEGAALLGMNTRLVASMVWGIAAVLSGLASVASLTLHGIDLAARDGGTSALLPALAAAMVAGFESVLLAAFAAVWLSVIQQAMLWVYPNTVLFEPLLLAVVIIALLLRRGVLQRRQTPEAGPWDAVRGLDAVPRALRAVPAVRHMRTSLITACIALPILFPFMVSSEQIHAGGTVMIDVMIAVSLLVVAGWMGQVNLGQFAVAAVGAVTVASLTGRFGVSFWVVLPVAAALAAGAGILLGLAALRVQGLWLAPVTLVFAAALPVLIFTSPWSSLWLPAHGIERPRMLWFDLNDERTLYYALLLAAGLAVLSAVALRRSLVGRMVIALRDNEAAALAAGIDPLRPRMVALALSGAIAGVAGALLAVHEQAVGADQFGPALSLNVFVMLILGGLGGVTGAVLGTVFGASMLHLTPDYAPLITGVGALLMLLLFPGGLTEAVRGVRNATLRLVAARHQLAVPALGGTTDAAHPFPWPLAPLDRSSGLASLPTTERYAQSSLFFGPGRT